MTAASRERPLDARIRRPDTASWPFLVAAVSAWCGAGLARGTGSGWVILLAGALAGGWVLGRSPLVMVAAAGVLAGALSGSASMAREEVILDAQLPEGPAQITGLAVSDVFPGRYDERLVVRGLNPQWISGVRILVAGTLPPVQAGEVVEIRGRLRPGGFRVRGDPVGGSILAAEVEVVGSGAGVLLSTANWMRDLVVSQVAPERTAGRALLAGFLVGDTRYLSPTDADALRRAGLSHFVAVSGSNVALFLGLWWLLVAPVTQRPLLRSGLGLVGLVVFVLLTRWEPSVVRAAAMAGAILVGRGLGLALSSWSALGLGVAGCLVVSGELAGDIGFQLSVAATMGVMAGSDVIRIRPRWLGSALAATLSAQIAVGPLLLWNFGAVPLFSPVANILAVPLVTIATAAAGIGTITHVAPLVALAEVCADLVIRIATLAAPWPQIGSLGFAVALIGLGSVVWVPRSRWLLAVAATGIVIWSQFDNGAVTRPAVVFLDVGQGDAALILAESFTVLIDGGPDPVVLSHRLDTFGISRIDLLIVSHVHADHVEGLDGLFGRVDIGTIWQAFGDHETEASTDFLTRAEDARIEVATPVAGTALRVNNLALEVVGPLRRYASPNDESLVVVADLAGTRILFAGDAETYAQADLGSLRPDILKVPHQGAATSDPSWLATNAGQVAVISVGPNDFGHPAAWVVEVLERAGATVARTDLQGDVILELGE